MAKEKKIEGCKHSVIGSMSVSRCANCGMTFAGIRKKYIEEIKQTRNATIERCKDKVEAIKNDLFNVEFDKQCRGRIEFFRDLCFECFDDLKKEGG